MGDSLSPKDGRGQEAGAVDDGDDHDLVLDAVDDPVAVANQMAVATEDVLVDDRAGIWMVWQDR
jgi:hypothetical protein